MRKVLFSIVLCFYALCVTQPAHACPDIDGLVDLNCDQLLVAIFFGDSITAGVQDELGLGYPGRVNLIFPSMIAVNLGVPGEKTPTGRARAAQVFPTYPNTDYVVALEGVNDFFLSNPNALNTRNNMLSIISSGANTGAITLLGNLTAVRRSFQRGWVSSVNGQLNPFKNIDFFSLGEGIISSDLLHPDGTGYQAMANLAAAILLQTSELNRPVDSDNDGIYDFAEPRFGSNPFDDDSDDDGLLDGAEVFIHGSSPLLLDTDSDGFTDPQEVNVIGSNPADPRPGPPTITELQPLQGS